MDTDTVREKYVRSEESLNRIRDDITQLIHTRLQEFKATKDYLETLIKEKEAVDTQITEQEAKISSFKEQIINNKKLIENMKNKQVAVVQEEQIKENQFQDVSREHQELLEKSESIRKNITKVKQDIETVKNSISDYQKKIQTLNTEITQGIENKEQELGILRRELSQIQEKNNLLYYLLNESAEDIPEVNILAVLMHKGRITQDQIKQSLEAQISPVIVTRTLGRMVEKKIIKFHETDNIYSANQAIS